MFLSRILYTAIILGIDLLLFWRYKWPVLILIAVVCGIIIAESFFKYLAFVSRLAENRKKLSDEKSYEHMKQLSKSLGAKFYITDEDVVLAVRTLPSGLLRETVVLTGNSKEVGALRQGAGSPVTFKKAREFLADTYGKTDAEAHDLLSRA